MQCERLPSNASSLFNHKKKKRSWHRFRVTGRENRLKLEFVQDTIGQLCGGEWVYSTSIQGVREEVDALKKISVVIFSLVLL